MICTDSAYHLINGVLFASHKINHNSKSSWWEVMKFVGVVEHVVANNILSEKSWYLDPVTSFSGIMWPPPARFSSKVAIYRICMVLFDPYLHHEDNV